ncbi:MAG: DUF3035 domain-containing protein [Pseudomonadota bacterium]
MFRLVYVFLLLIISACSNNFKEKVGLVKNQPDEYQVISNQPLSVPNDLQTVLSPEEEMKKENAPVDKNHLTKGENILLKNIGN